MNYKTAKTNRSDKLSSVHKPIIESNSAVAVPQLELSTYIYPGCKFVKCAKPKQNTRHTPNTTQILKKFQKNRFLPRLSVPIDYDHEDAIEKLIELQSKISVAVKEIYKSEIIELDSFSDFIVKRCSQ